MHGKRDRCHSSASSFATSSLTAAARPIQELHIRHQSKWRGQVKPHGRHLVRARREERGIEKLSIEGLGVLGKATCKRQRELVIPHARGEGYKPDA